jgi:hypothetical protein
VKASPELGAFKRGRSRGQQVRKLLVCEVAAVLPLSVQEDRGKQGRGESPKLRGPEAGRHIVKRHPPCNECGAAGAGGVKGAKGGRRGPHSHVGGAGRCQEGGIGLKGGGEPQAKPAEVHGKGELGNHRIRLHVSGRRVLHHVVGSEKLPPFGGSDVGESRDHAVMQVRWVRRACREERSWRNLSWLPRGREARAVTQTRLSRGAATSSSGRRAIPRAEAMAKPVAADWAYAAHLGREGVRPIGAGCARDASRPHVWQL